MGLDKIVGLRLRFVMSTQYDLILCSHMDLRFGCSQDKYLSWMGINAMIFLYKTRLIPLVWIEDYEEMWFLQ